MSHLSWKDNGGWTSMCLKWQFYPHDSKDFYLTLTLKWSESALYQHAQCTPFWWRHGKPCWLLCKFCMKSYPESDWNTSMWEHKLQDYEKWATKHVCVCRRHLSISQLARASRHGVIFKKALANCTGCLINVLSHLNILCLPWLISAFWYSGCCFSLGSSDTLIP